MIYKCEPCNYETNDKSNLTRHKKSMKCVFKSNEQTIKSVIGNPKLPKSNPKSSTNNKIGKEKEDNKKIECDGCGKQFTYKQGLSKHKKKCKSSDKLVPMSQVEEMVKKIKRDTEFKIIKLENELLKQRLRDKDDDMKDFKNIATTAVKTNNKATTKTISALSYVIKNFKNAPAIHKFSNYPLLVSDDKKKSISEIVIHYHDKGELAKFVGDKLLLDYKKADPSKQCIWSTDVVRSTYMIHDEIDDELTWCRDKGNKVSEYVIMPALKHIKDELINYKSDLNWKIQNDEISALSVYKKIESASEITQSIDSGKLVKEIIKYICPFLYLSAITSDVKKLQHDTNTDEADDTDDSDEDSDSDEEIEEFDL
jgi:hypothetical protein